MHDQDPTPDDAELSSPSRCATMHRIDCNMDQVDRRRGYNTLTAFTQAAPLLAALLPGTLEAQRCWNVGREMR